MEKKFYECISMIHECSMEAAEYISTAIIVTLTLQGYSPRQVKDYIQWYINSTELVVKYGFLWECQMFCDHDPIECCREFDL